MFAARDLEAADVFEVGDLDLAEGLPVKVPDQFGLQGPEETFDCGNVATICFAAL